MAVALDAALDAVSVMRTPVVDSVAAVGLAVGDPHADAVLVLTIGVWVSTAAVDYGLYCTE